MRLTHFLNLILLQNETARVRGAVAGEGRGCAQGKRSRRRSGLADEGLAKRRQEST